jgi:NAD-dependent deacetylase
MNVEEILDIGFFRLHPDVFYAWAKDVWYKLEDFEPNVVHKTLATLENKGYLDGIFTQNIDMLHTRAGAKKVYEVHGSAKHHYCTKCGAHYDYKDIAPIVLNDEVPHCKQCGGLIKPDIVFYGEGLNSSILMRAEHMFSDCDLCLVLGSSLVVQPAASFPMYTARRGKGKIVMVNKQHTSLDSYAALHFDDLEKLFVPLNEFANSLSQK